jgi:hypothetical protein
VTRTRPRSPRPKTARPPTCPGGCGQRVKWALTAADRHQALNPDPHPAGTVAAYCDVHGVWHVRTLKAGEEPDRGLTERRYQVHWATCAAKAGGVNDG